MSTRTPAFRTAWAPGARVGPYRLLGPLAAGGMAEIWLARQSGVRGFEKVVVIKRMIGALEDEPEYVEMFMREARLAALLAHPHVVQVFELGEVEGSLYIVMEYLDGESLAGVRRKEKAKARLLSDELVVFICAQVAEGLHYAHTLKAPDGTPLDLVHRDVSPQNIIVTCEGGVKLVDFGVAKASTQATGSGKLKGKLGYMSPEQGRSEPVDRRADVFSLGVVLYEHLTHTRMYGQQADLTVLRQVIGEEPLPRASSVRPDLPPALDDIVARATARDRNQRFQTARDLQLALEGWLRSSGGTASSGELGAWVREMFADRMQLRRAMIEGAAHGEFVKVATQPVGEPTISGDAPAFVDPTFVRPGLRGSTALQLAAGTIAVFAGAAAMWLALTRPANPVRPPGAPVASAPVPTPATLPASLSVETEPPGAQVLIDGAPRGTAPVQVESLPAGQHTLTVRLANYLPADRTLTFSAGSRSVVVMTLARAAETTTPSPEVAPRHATGRLNLSSKPWVSVYFGAVKLGDTPLVNVTLPAGKHLLRLINPEQQIDQTIAVEIDANATTVKKLQL